MCCCQASSIDDWEPLADLREAERRKREKAEQRLLACASPEERARMVRSAWLHLRPASLLLGW